MTGPALFLAVVVLSGCSGDRAEPRGSAEQAVTAVLRAIEASDCEQLEAATGGAFRDKLAGDGCANVLETFAHEGGLVRFSVDRIEPDGRSPGVALVHVELDTARKQRKLILRAEPVDGRWAVTQF